MKKKNISQKSTVCNSHGFTLIELLAVVAIVMIMAGLILAGVNVARDRAKVLHAKRDIAQLKTAWEAYYADYSGFPQDAGNPFPITESNIACIQILRGVTNAVDSAEVKQYRAMNPKKISYMDFHHKTTEFLDPWGNRYRIAMDDDYNGEVTVPGGTVRQSVAAWSVGKDGVEGTDDDVRSWR